MRNNGVSMPTRIEIFKLFGIPVRVDPSWLLILVMVTYSLASGYFPAELPGYEAASYWGMGFVGAVALFASILFHEFSHALVARRYQIQINGITLFIFGGVAEIEDEAATPKAEFFMAVAGPLASMLLALVFFGLHEALSQAHGNPGLILLFYYLFFSNALLALFNLIPAFPLDGGRIFRSILWAFQKNYDRATRIAARVGQGFAWLLIGYGGYQVIRGDIIGGFWYTLIGFFLKQASANSLKQIGLKRILEAVPVHELMHRQFSAYRPNDSLLAVGGDLGRELIYTHFPVVAEERYLGYLSLRDLEQLDAETWELGIVRDVYHQDDAEMRIAPDDNAWDALRRMRGKHSANLFVVSAGKLEGIVTIDDLMSSFTPKKK